MIKAVLLLLFGGLKFGKLALTGGTMLLSLAIYAQVWGWRYAAGFIILLFIHEMGHYIAARQRGLNVGAPTFIPFVGAWIDLKEVPRDVETEAHVAISGPLLGSFAAFLVYFAADYYDSKLLLAIAYAGFFLNLFNMLPISPLDGGRVTAVLSPRIWFLGAPMLLAMIAWRPSPVLFMLAIIAAPQLLRAWRYDPDAADNVAYYGIPAAKKLEYTVMYLGLTGALAFMTFEVHGRLAGVG